MRGDLNPCADEADRFEPLGHDVKALLVWPTFPNSFWSFQGSMPIFGKQAFQPPLGLITVAALCPKAWTIRLIDESVEPVHDSDIEWADLVMVSGMIVQAAGIRDILCRARQHETRTIVGGPYASSQPNDLRGLADHIVVGEPDEVFDQIARDLEEGTVKSIYEIREKPDVSKTPIPRFDLLKTDAYVLMALQRSLQRGIPQRSEITPAIPLSNTGILLRSLWYQGVHSTYRREYWRFLWLLLRHWAREPAKLAIGFMILISAHHFIPYAAEVVSSMDGELDRLESKQQTPEDSMDGLRVPAIASSSS